MKVFIYKLQSKFKTEIMKKIFFIIVALLITLAGTGQTAKEYFNQGLDKYDRQDYSGSIIDYTKAIELNP